MGDIEKYIGDSIKDMKDSIDRLNSKLNERINELDHKLNQIHLEYSQRIVALEESNKSGITTKLLISLVGVLIGYIINHLLS